ncbi:MAG: hypothetical protein HYT44_03420 [Nitrosarchaeum sp.]|nr:hypothetical protein [Nitrosarchaeum sp.]
MKEDDDVDVVFALESQLKTSKEISPICIQLKRFGHYQYQKDTEAMIEFLNTIKLKYGPSHSALVIFFDGHKGINVEKVHKDINWLGFPFTRVMFINTTKNEAGVWKFHIGEFWPTWGYNEYNPDDLVKQKPK